jgi:hypothetical protein
LGRPQGIPGSKAGPFCRGPQPPNTVGLVSWNFTTTDTVSLVYCRVEDGTTGVGAM